MFTKVICGFFFQLYRNSKVNMEINKSDEIMNILPSDEIVKKGKLNSCWLVKSGVSQGSCGYSCL